MTMSAHTHTYCYPLFENGIRTGLSLWGPDEWCGFDHRFPTEYLWLWLLHHPLALQELYVTALFYAIYSL